MSRDTQGASLPYIVVSVVVDYACNVTFYVLVSFFFDVQAWLDILEPQDSAAALHSLVYTTRSSEG